MIATLSTRARATLFSLLVLAFVAGGAAGVLAGRSLARRPTIRATLDMSSVLDELNLTPEQRHQADAIVGRSAPRARAVMTELSERLRSVADSADVELRAILTPDQRERLDAMRADRRLVMKRKVVTPSGTRVDTVIDTSAPRP